MKLPHDLGEAEFAHLLEKVAIETPDISHYASAHSTTS